MVLCITALIPNLPGNQKEIIYKMSVCPAMHFVILHPFDLGKVPNYAEFNEVLNEPLISEIFRNISGISGKPKYTVNIHKLIYIIYS